MRKTLVAQSFSLGVTLLTQLALTPFLIGSWGVSKFGVWVLLTAASAYVVYVELGYTYVAKNLMVAQKARSDSAYTDSYHAAGSVVLLASGLLLPVLCATAAVIMLALPNTASREIAVCAVLLAIQAVFQTHTLLICTAQRAEYGPATESGFSACIRLIEALAVLLTIQISDSIAGAALAMCLVRLTFNSAAYVTLTRTRPQYAVRWPSIARIKSYFRDSIAYLLIPLTQSLFIQVPVLVIGWTLSPLQVAIYATTRTLARSGTAFASVLFNSAGPEIAKLSGRQVGRVRGLANRMILSALIFGVALAAALIVFGDLGMSLLTKDQIGVEQPFFLVMVSAVLVEVMWTALFTVLGALNVHVSGARMLFAAGIVACVLVYPTSSAFGLTGAACALLVAHGVVLLMAISQYLKNVPPKQH
jgi:O-antigen/teichoic acid export membrane protein